MCFIIWVPRKGRNLCESYQFKVSLWVSSEASTVKAIMWTKTIHNELEVINVHQYDLITQIWHIFSLCLRLCRTLNHWGLVNPALWNGCLAICSHQKLQCQCKQKPWNAYLNVFLWLLFIWQQQAPFNINRNWISHYQDCISLQVSLSWIAQDM